MRIYSEISVVERDDPGNRSSIYLDPGGCTAQEIAEYFIALSELHRAMYGGTGLTFTPTGSLFTDKHAPKESRFHRD